MNVQLIDPFGIIRFRTFTGEPVCDHLMGALPGGQPLSVDKELDAQELDEVLERIHCDLQHSVRGIQQMGRDDPFVTHFRALGQDMLLYPRNSEHAAVMRLADLHQALVEAKQARVGLCLFFVPELNAAQFVTLSCLKPHTEGISDAELRALTKIELQRRASILGVPEDSRQIYRSANAQLDDTVELARSLKLFVTYGLVKRSDDRSLLVPTRKLRDVIL